MSNRKPAPAPTPAPAAAAAPAEGDKQPATLMKLQFEGQDGAATLFLFRQGTFKDKEGVAHPYALFTNKTHEAWVKDKGAIEIADRLEKDAPADTPKNVYARLWGKAGGTSGEREYGAFLSGYAGGVTDTGEVYKGKPNPKTGEINEEKVLTLKTALVDGEDGPENETLVSVKANIVGPKAAEILGFMATYSKPERSASPRP